MRLHEITVSRVAESQAKHCGFTGNIAQRIRGIAAASSPSQHAHGNRTYGPYVLHMVDTDVVSFAMIGPVIVDERSVHECKICQGLMLRKVWGDMNGHYGFVTRPCQRSFNPTAPLCDTLVKKVPQ